MPLKRFSIRQLLLLVTFVAIALGVWLERRNRGFQCGHVRPDCYVDSEVNEAINNTKARCSNLIDVGKSSPKFIQKCHQTSIRSWSRGLFRGGLMGYLATKFNPEQASAAGFNPSHTHFLSVLQVPKIVG
jgi:hypothetical protein